MNVHELRRKWNTGLLGYPTQEEIEFLFDHLTKLEAERSEKERKYRQEKTRRLVIYKGKPYAVTGEQTSISNGTRELILRGNDGPLVVLASECQ